MSFSAFNVNYTSKQRYAKSDYKNTDYNQQLPFKGQLSSNRYVPLTEVKDFEQLKKVGLILEKMEKDIEDFLKDYQEDADKHEKKHHIGGNSKMTSKLLKGMFKA